MKLQVKRECLSLFSSLFLYPPLFTQWVESEVKDHVILVTLDQCLAWPKKSH